jgi:hypothetical protein
MGLCWHDAIYLPARAVMHPAAVHSHRSLYVLCVMYVCMYMYLGAPALCYVAHVCAPLEFARRAPMSDPMKRIYLELHQQ